MQRLKTRPQFQAAMAGGTVSRTAHFALHRLVLGAQGSLAAADSASVAPTGPGSLPSAQGPQALFAVQGVWLGAMVPKRWARRAVTRNTIKRQIYTVGDTFESRLEQVAPQSAHVVRLRSGFDRKQFVSATSDQLKQAVRAELLQLFGYATRRAGGGASAAPAAAGVAGAGAGPDAVAGPVAAAKPAVAVNATATATANSAATAPAGQAATAATGAAIAPAASPAAPPAPAPSSAVVPAPC